MKIVVRLGRLWRQESDAGWFSIQLEAKGEEMYYFVYLFIIVFKPKLFRYYLKRIMPRITFTIMRMMVVT